MKCFENSFLFIIYCGFGPKTGVFSRASVFLKQSYSWHSFSAIRNCFEIFRIEFALNSANNYCLKSTAVTLPLNIVVQPNPAFQYYKVVNVR